ncbi:probable G-protein coupled receptor 139 [Pristis pectinata]|uniref:probable G-protein coupled receptor 139 n=1 Tax=Pristis pectinata TaxID=685728 RepID=UPI00223CC38E|nr:probable G-protein coupled receptor 139 [Pristis pectinata]
MRQRKRLNGGVLSRDKMDVDSSMDEKCKQSQREPERRVIPWECERNTPEPTGGLARVLMRIQTALLAPLCPRFCSQYCGSSTMGRAPILYVKEMFYPIMAAVGIPANVVTAAILYRENCGLSRGITRYMMAMAISDLFVLIFHVLLGGIYIYYSPISFLTLSTVCPTFVYLRIVALDYSVWLTVSFTFDRFVSICCPKLRLTYCTERTAAVVIVSLCALSCLKFIPFYFMYQPRYVMNKVNWGCRQKDAYFTSIWWLAFSWMSNISLSLLPFALILLLNGLTVKNIIASSRIRRRLKGQDGKDCETENRRKSIVLLFTVSGTSILLGTTGAVTFICTRITINFVGKDLTSPSNIANEVGVLLIRVSCCVNTSIYAMTQGKFRQELTNGIKSLARFIIKPMKLAMQAA